MSMWIQISVGLIPAFVILLIYMVVSKKNIFPSLCILVLIGTGIGAGIFYNSSQQAGSFEKNNRGGVTAFSRDLNSQKSGKSFSAPSEDGIKIIYELAAGGDTKNASELLKQIIKENGYSQVHALAQARIYAASKNYSAASVLYEKSEEVWDEFAEQEYDAVKKACAALSVDEVLLAHMDSSVTEQIFENAPEQTDLANAEEQVVNCLKEIQTQKDNHYSGMAELLSDTNQIYESFLIDGQKNDSQIRNLESELVQWETQSPEISSLKQVKTARMKLQILQGHYQEIASGLTEASGYDEIMVASELYLNGYVEKSDFTGSYVQTDDESLRIVTDRLKEIQSGDDAALVQPAGELLNIYKEYEKDAPLYQMEQSLLESATNRSITDASKIYLQMAKIELGQSREDKAKKYIGLAMDTASDCEDPEYTGPMYQIMGIMANKDEAESLKEVALYTDNVLNNQLEIIVPDSLSDSSPESPDFSGYVTDYVSMKRSALNIMSLDTSQFEQITAYVQIESSAGDNLEELKKKLTIEDTGVQIQDYTLEKVEYTSANMLLCCDISGSMNGVPIEDSRAALANLADSMTGDTRLGVALFNTGAQGVTYFTREPDQIRQAAEMMSSGGGTNIFDTVLSGLDSFPLQQNTGVLNTLIVMSDGQDNNLHNIEEIESQIGSWAKKRSILVHCLGLGPDVDANYLQSIAQSSGGTYQYVTEPSSLSVFYKNIAGQKNRTYKLQYRAQDTLSVDRQLRVSLDDSEFLYDTWSYTLPGSEGQVDDEQADLIYNKNLSIRGLDTRFLFKSINPAAVKLLGTGFKKEDSISVKMVVNNGGTYGISYDVTPVFEDASTYKLTIPSSVACGVYDVRVTINGKTAILSRELTIQVQGSEQTTAFGPYVFTSYQKQVLDERTILNGYVTMNNWLCFKGDVVLRGNINNSQIELADYTGSYIRYYSDRSKGLASFMSKLNMVMPLPPLERLTLYNDIGHQASSDDYRVDTGIIPFLSFKSVFTLATPGYSLYPDRMKIDAVAFDTKFPYQDKLLPAPDAALFTFDVEKFQGILTPDNIGIVADLKLGSNKKVYYPINVVNMPLNICPSGGLKVDTLKNEYEIDLNASMMFFNDGDLGITIKWENDLIPKKLMLGIPVKKTVFISGVPVTFDDFELGVDDLNIFDLLSTTMVGKMDASACSVQALVPQVKKYLKDDLSLIKLEDATLSFRAKKFLIEAKTTVKILENIEIGNALLQIGNFSYTNELLGMDSEDVQGINGRVGLGFTFANDNCDLGLKGTGEVTLTNRFMGLKGTGDSHFKISWWVLVKEFYANGLATIGYYEDHSKVGTFAIRFRSSGSDGKQNNFSIAASQNGLYLNESKIF